MEGMTPRIPLRAGSLVLLLGVLSLPLLAQGRGPSPVVVARVSVQNVVIRKSHVGTVFPLRTTTVGSRVEGAVVELLVREGDAVAGGDVLARLEPALIESDVRASQAELELRQKELLELENGSRPEEVARAKARMEGARSLRDYARASLARTRDLHEKDELASADALESAESLAASSEKSYQAAQSEFELVRLGPRPEIVDQARARVRSQEAAVRRSEILLANHTILAPFKGQVLREHTQVGAWLVRGGPVVDLVDLAWVEVRISVLEDYVQELRLGAPVVVSFPSLDDQVHEGVIQAILPQADARTREFPVRVRLENRASTRNGGGLLLRAGMSGRVELPVGQGEALVVHKDALVLGDKPLVYVVDEIPGKSATVRAVPVRVGESLGDQVRVEGELRPGLLVVVRGNERLRPGQEVVVTGGLERGERP
jgi:multidrug efflux pump subunit AcrA (membrane-fusion protein)